MKQSTREKLDTYSTLYDTFKTIVLVIILIILVPKVCQEVKEVRDTDRLTIVQEMMEEGDYNAVLEYMVEKEIYEPEFEYIWERLEFYTCYQRYLMYVRAAGANPEKESYIENLNRYAAMLLNLYENVEYEEYVEFVQKYYDKATKEEEKIPLERAQLQEWSRYLNRWDKNGFVLSYYDTPEDVDLNELFYSGCGVNQRELSDKEIADYLEITGTEEIYTDCVRLTTRDIASVLRNGLGLEREDMKKSLDWVYLEDSECYVTQHGDTNAARFTVTSGYRQGKNVILNCVSMEENHNRDCRVTLKNAEGDTWYFVSNEKIENTEDVKSVWLIEEQCFEVELNGFGNVKFESYEPEASIGVFYPPSVSFELTQEDESIYQFPEVYSEGSLEATGTYENIKAVAFKDVNADDYTDVIVIIAYEEGDAVRIYGGRESDFYYMEELSANINAEGKTLIMKDVFDYIGLGQQTKNVTEVADDTENTASDNTAYDEIATLIGEDVATQIRIMADNFLQWKMTDYPGVANYAVYDLDGDGRLELMANVVMGSGLFSENHFYQVNEDNTGLIELGQKPDDVGILEFDIAGAGYENHGKAYIDENGRILYATADYGKSGISFVGCSEGYYYLENGTIYNEEIRSYTTDYTEDENGVFSYYGAGPGEAITEEEWEALYQNFVEGKQEIESGIAWKSLYEEETEEMNADDWFELLAESYNSAI